MDTPTPSLDALWSWLVAIVPPEWRPLLGIVGTLGVFVWLIVRFLQPLWQLLLMWQRHQHERKVRKELAPLPDKLPAPRVSIWDFEPVSPPRPILVRNGGIPILTTANMKGGVGKTTLTANLAAYLDGQGKRVLILDLDYQGSLSQTMLAAANKTRMGSAVDDLIRGKRSMRSILGDAETLGPALARTRILTCYYEFADTETHEMVNWFTARRNGDAPDDVRFRLAALLQDKSVQEQFDIVLIDAPPRFSTATINALCASTHLLIPTVLDQMSAEAVVFFSRDVSRMRNRLFPNLRLIGVAPTLVYRVTGFTKREQGIIDYLNRALQSYWGETAVVRTAAAVPRKNAIGDVSGVGIAYVNTGTPTETRTIRTIFDGVGKEVFKPIKEEIRSRSTS